MKHLYDLQWILVGDLGTETSNFGVNSNTTSSTGCSDHILKYSTCICLGDGYGLSILFKRQGGGKMNIYFSP